MKKLFNLALAAAVVALFVGCGAESTIDSISTVETEYYASAYNANVPAMGGGGE